MKPNLRRIIKIILNVVFAIIILATAAETMFLVGGMAPFTGVTGAADAFAADGAVFIVISVYIPLILIESEFYFNLRYFIHVQNKTRYKTVVNTVFCIIEIAALALSPHFAVSLLGLPFLIIPMGIAFFLCGLILLHTAVRFVWWVIETVRRNKPTDGTELVVSL